MVTNSSTAKIHQNNIRSNLFNIAKRDFVLISEEKAPNPTLFRYNQFSNAAITLVKFQIHNVPKLTAVLHTDNFLFAKFIECHKTTIKHRITISYAIRRIMCNMKISFCMCLLQTIKHKKSFIQPCFHIIPVQTENKNQSDFHSLQHPVL